ncbi:MAG: RloB domain-containing protein [Bacteroidaceae bacterium]|nr:RloB domain-containing protein [Bacteroidaceae bacterium]
MARIRQERELRRSRITVIGEGLTERWYFNHLRTVMGYRYDCKPRFFTHQSYQEMRKLIDSVLQNDGIAVCVCDADITLSNPEEKKRLEEMKQAYATEEGKVFICDSMPSIEFWFLLHYLETSKQFRTSDEVAQVLRRYMPTFQKHSTFLEKIQWVKDLCAGDKLQQAYTRAEAFGKNPEATYYSNIYTAIKLFNGQIKK